MANEPNIKGDIEDMDIISTDLFDDDFEELETFSLSECFDFQSNIGFSDDY